MSAFEAVASAIDQLGGEREFFAKYWDACHGHVTATASGYRDQQGMVEELDHFLDRTDIRYPSLRLVRDGVEVPLADYARELRLGPHISNDWIVNEEVFARYNAGATIVLQMLQHCVPGFGQSANAIETMFGANVQLSAFITPPSAQGFTAHYDTYSFFAIQLYGSKRWSLYDRTSLLPVRDDRDSDDKWVEVPPTCELKLCAGDVLFVPRGLYHSAKTSDEPSVHMTVGIFRPTLLDVFRDSLPLLQAGQSLRQSVSTSAADDSASIRTFVGERLDPSYGLERTRARVFDRHIDARSGRLADLLSRRFESSDRFVRQPIPYVLASGPNALHLRYCGKELTFPSFSKELIEYICAARGPFSRQSLPRIIDDDSRNVLLEHLVTEGFIRSALDPH
jgi:Cupin superfamily protein